MKNFFLFLALFFIYYSTQASDSARLEVYFPFNKFELTNSQEAKIDSFVKAYDSSKFTIKNISVSGHTDQIGRSEYNEILSLKRANYVVDCLKKKQAQGNFIYSINGFGKRQLVTISIDEKERFYNRRVVLTFSFEEKKTLVSEKIVEKPTSTAGNPERIKPKTKRLAEWLNDTTLKVGDKIELPYILFIGGLHEFLNISYPYLDELFYVMRDNPNLEIEIQGHICCQQGIGDAIDNGTGKINLSVARASAVYDFLRKSGIAASRMSYKGFGHQFPITLERTEEQKTRNRRVEIKIIKK